LDDPLLKEGIRMVRTPLLQQIDNQPGSIVLITSASPGDGKTTVAAMLARSLAWCGRNVLLVDADLRNPRVCQHLGIDAAGGFLEALTGQVDDSRLIVQTDTPRLSVLPGCHVEAGLDPELIANGAFSAAAARWRGKYDVILVDSPPVLPVADARILARHADGTILVTWAQRTRRADVVDALTYLASAGGRLLGTVFICSPRRGRHGYSSTYNRGAQR
jgi:capsular exopolysaccharide synthesis family protein